MAFQRPTLAELVGRIQSDFVSRLNLTGALLRNSLVYVLARVQAGAAHMLHGHLEFLGRQLFPDLAEDEFLVRQAALRGLTKNPPTFATAIVIVTGAAGIIPAGVSLIRADGQRYVSTVDFDGDGTPSGMQIVALNAGALPSLAIGMVLVFESPISGFDSAISVDFAAEGVDLESTESLRSRLKALLADPPNGGKPADYVEWSKEVAGVTRVWVRPLALGPGTVLVYFARDNDASLIPDAGEVAVVQAKLNLEAPAHATVTVAAPVAAPQNFTIAVVPNTVAVKNAVTAQLTDLFKAVDPGSTLLLAQVRTAIGTAAGLTDYTMTVPAANVVLASNQLPTTGTITWV